MHETERLILREWEDKDIEPFYQMSKDPKVMEYFPELLDREKTIELIDRQKKSQSENGFCFWAVEEKENEAFVGIVGLGRSRFDAHFTPCVEVGWRLAREHWGKGYATEAGRKSLDLAFGSFGLEEIVALTTTNNKKSMAVMERLGMTRDPEEDFDHPLVDEGPLKRHVLYRIRNQD